ncbi:type 4 pilus major pilin [Cupriavidus basilensis]|uniref:type 4 pilus major pilin n=1 Tax=Cupriavidus basilensis TaxID=68895 RepID=UPI0023E8EC49|nr:type 4 pilus major pilin [Cupriavidus basilensis]MDF3882683.1 type 4 pilus major pilin [Cupriavidus basilensis]
MNALQKDTSLEQVEMDNPGAEVGVQPVRDVSRMPEGSRNRRTRRQWGGVLDEYGFYLLLAGLALVAILVLFSRNQTDTQVQQLTTELNGVIGKVKTSYRGQYSKVSISALMGNGVFKDLTTMTETGSDIILQPGGGKLTVTAAQLLSANDSLQWSVPQQPDAACIAIVASYQGSAGKIVVNGTTIKAVGGAVDPSKVSCSGGSNTIDLYIA